MADGWVYLRRCSASLIISDRITMRYYLTFVEMVLIKGKQKVTVGEHVEKRQPLDTVGRNLNQCSCCGNSWEIPQNLETEVLFDAAVPFLGIYPKGLPSRF